MLRKCNIEQVMLILLMLLMMLRVPGVPVEASIEFEVDNESSFGAVLTTEKPVTREYYLRHKEPWIDWIKQNSKKLMKKYGDEIGEYKLWIITQVYMTTTARINILQSSKRKVSIGFKADVAQIGKLQPHGGWSTDNKNDGWSVHSSKVRVPGVGSGYMH